MKRELDIVVISDVHLGTYGCHARELNNYLKSIEPRTLVPRVIRSDHRYEPALKEAPKNGPTNG